MFNPQFHKCTLAELEQLQKLSLTTFVDAFGAKNEEANMKAYTDDAFSLEHLKEELSNENSIFYFVKSREIIVGYFKVNVGPAQTEPIADGFEVERIYLLNPYQGIGIGQLMFDKIFELARKLKKTRLWLGVWEENYGAIRFYERNGFKQFGQHSFFLGDDLQNDLLFELILKIDEESF